LELAKLIHALRPGDEVLLTGSDPGILMDIPDWCRALGHELVDIRREGDKIIAQVRCRKR